MNTTKEALTPYYNFLNEAIKAEEQKGSYEVDWKKIESNFSLSIIPIYSKFKIEKPKTVFKVFIEDLEILKDTRNKLFFDEQDEIVRFDKADIKIEENYVYFDIEKLPREEEILEINNSEVTYELTNFTLTKDDILVSQNQNFLEQLLRGKPAIQQG